MKRFSRKISSVLLVALVALALIGCSSTAKVEAVPGIVVATPTETTVPAAEAPAPAPEVVEPAPVPEVVEEKPLVARDIAMYGYSASIDAYDGYANVTYPEIVTVADLQQAVAALNAAYPGELNGVLYDVKAPGQMVVTYPKGLSAKVLNGYIDVLQKDLAYYVTSLYGTPAPAVEVEPVVEEVVVEEKPIVSRDISMYGYSASIDAYDGYANVTYPEIVTAEDLQQAVAALNAAYPGALEGVVYDVKAPGQMVVTYPKGLGEAVINGCIDVLQSDLAYYVSSLFAAPASEPTAVEESVKEEPAPVATAPVVDPAVYDGGIVEIVKNTKGDEEFDLYVVHTNDVHARIVPADGGMGYSKFATLLKGARAMTDNILLLDAGDVTHGTNLANAFKGQTVGVLLNMLGYDAVAPGNHDFNYGADVLIETAKNAKEMSNLRVLAANITDENGALVFQPYQVYDYNGYKVVVIGLTTPDTKTKAHPKNTEGLEFMSDEIIKDAQALVDYANEIGDFVVVLGHIGLDADGSSGITSDWICSNVNGIDLFVDGHSHSVLEHGMKVGDTLIVSAGEYLKNFGVVEVHFSPEGVEIRDARLVTADEVNAPAGTILDTAFGIKEVANDPEVDAYIASVEKELDDLYSVVVADVPFELDGAREHVRTRKTNLSKLIVKAMTAESGADFTITNGGGIRASIDKGEVTLGEINTVLPFTNTITVCEITPAEVYAALEHGYSKLPETNGAYSQTDLQVVYSKSAPAGSRIMRVLLNGKLLDRNDTTTVYKVATNDFMAAGGDGYTMFGRKILEGKMLNEVFADYLQKVYPAK